MAPEKGLCLNRFRKERKLAGYQLLITCFQDSS